MERINTNKKSKIFDFTERFLEFCDHLLETKAFKSHSEIGAACELSRNTMSTLVNRKINISLQNVQQVLVKFPDLSSDWLVMGVGSMLRGGSVDLHGAGSGVNLEVENRYLAEKVSLLESIISNKDALLRRDEEYITLLKAR